MRVFVKETNFGRKLSISYLINQGYAFYYCRRQNRFLALQGNYISNITQVIIEHKKDKPLWKQSMELQMGRIPTQNITREILDVQELLINDCMNKFFETYVIIS